MGIKKINTNKAPAAVGPYSQAIVCGNTMFISGQIPIDPETGEMAGNDIEAQTHRVFKSLKAIVEEAKSSMDNVLKVGVFITDLNDFQAVNQIYQTYFSEPYPARFCVEVSRLPKDAMIEIEATVCLLFDGCCVDKDK